MSAGTKIAGGDFFLLINAHFLGKPANTRHLRALISSIQSFTQCLLLSLLFQYSRHQGRGTKITTGWRHGGHVNHQNYDDGKHMRQCMRRPLDFARVRAWVDVEARGRRTRCSPGRISWNARAAALKIRRHQRILRHNISLSTIMFSWWLSRWVRIKKPCFTYWQWNQNQLPFSLLL